MSTKNFSCLLLFVASLALADDRVESGPAAAILAGPEQSPVLAGILTNAAVKAGYRPTAITLGELSATESLQQPGVELLMIPNGRHLPLNAAATMEAFLKGGGRMVVLGAPAWSDPVLQVGERWLSYSQIQSELASIRPEALLAEFAPGSLKDWERYSDNSATPAIHEIVSDVAVGTVLHVRTDRVTGWETYGAPLLKSAVAPQCVTCFRARGGTNTKALLLEWREKDNSRWLATVKLETEWRDYVLTPADFKPWTPPPGRGGPKDCLKMENAARFVVGLAVSHAGQLAGAQEYWFANFGVAPNPFSGFQAADQKQLPQLEGLSPAYRFYDITGPVDLHVPQAQAIAAKLQEPPVAFHPRPSGAGFAQARPWRWESLLEARSEKGDYRGALGVLYQNQISTTSRSAMAVFTPAGDAFYLQAPIQELVDKTVARLRNGWFLHDGGAEFFTAFDQQEIRLGATVGHLRSSLPGERKVIVEVTADGAVEWRREWRVEGADSGMPRFEDKWTPTNWTSHPRIVTATLWQDGQRIDSFSHELHVWRAPAHPHWVTFTNSGFQLDGAPWKAHGVNYMPSSGIAQDGAYFEHWLGLGAYDPQIIQRDLERIKAMGFNCVSAFVYYQSLKSQHLLDFLRRCSELGLKVNQSLRPGTPMDFRWNEMKALIDYYQMASNDTIFAYDLAWEPSHFDHAYQERYARDWNRWIIARYGNATNALAAWDYRPTGAGETVPIPETSCLLRDGPWRKMVGDYRPFLDDLLADKYAHARELIRSVDSHHAVSFRMQLAGDPTYLQPDPLPYDFYGLRNCVDIWEPEAYGRIGDWNQVKPGVFTAAYARLCNANLPLVWAEVGYDILDAQAVKPDPAKLDFCAQYFRDFYRMLTMSGADGAIFWWYPGGYRINENSDYGLINPDGTDRIITRVIREEGAKFLRAPKPLLSSATIVVDRDVDARGLAGIYEKVKNEFWKTVEDGRQPVLKWKREPGALERAEGNK